MGVRESNLALTLAGTRQQEVKAAQQTMIDAEDPLRPLSDHKLAQMLNADGLNIARRTVAKYREAMVIPVARLRRKLT